MKQKTVAKFAVALALGATLVVTGCDRTVARTEDTKVRSDGSVKSTEKTVTEHPDGTVTRSETKTDSRP